MTDLPAIYGDYAELSDEELAAEINETSTLLHMTGTGPWQEQFTAWLSIGIAEAVATLKSPSSSEADIRFAQGRVKVYEDVLTLRGILEPRLEEMNGELDHRRRDRKQGV